MLPHKDLITINIKVWHVGPLVLEDLCLPGHNCQPQKTTIEWCLVSLTDVEL